MRGIKLKFNKVIYWFKVLDWARTHAKEVHNYKFLIELKDIAYERKLKAEREEKKEQMEKLEIQIKLIDKILKYVSR